MMENKIRDYLSQKNLRFKESQNELTIHCPFSDCDRDSTWPEAHCYIAKSTGQYYCQKCSEKGNMITLGKHFGDDLRYLFGDYKPVVETINITLNTKAQGVWDSSSIPPHDFPYLIKKKIQSNGARSYNNALVLPLYSTDGILSSLQFIYENGDKKFMEGGKVAGCFHIIGEPKETICVAEGFATASSIFEATGHATAIAFSSGNLKATACSIKEKYPSTEIIICGDTDENGTKKAKEVAEVLEIKLIFPYFGPDQKIDGKTPSDFNDLSVLNGAESVKSTILSAKLIPHKYSFTSLKALLDEPQEEINWIADGLLPAGGFSIVVAKPKIGKSTLARQAGLAVCRGEEFLGRKTTKGPVLYISLEEKRGEVKNHFQLMGATGNEDLGVYVGTIPEDVNKWILNETQSKKPVLVIIDTLFRFAQVTDVNDYSRVLKALDPLLDLARSQSTHVMCIHHARKSPGEGADSTLGSTAIFGSVDTAIVIKRTEAGKRTIETQQRYGSDIEPTILLFDPETKMTVLGGTKEEDDTNKVAEGIIEFLKSMKDPVNEATIDEEVTGKSIFKRKALRDLFAQGKLTRSGAGRKGDPYLYSCSLVPDIYMEQEKQITHPGGIGVANEPVGITN